MVQSSARRSVAIVELTGVHEEIIPSLIDALPEGVHADVFVNSRCRAQRGDLFAELHDLNATVTYVDIVAAVDWIALGARIDGGGHEALIISTFQIEGVALWARARRTPVIGVVHNPLLFQQSECCKGMLAEDALDIVALAPHVGARFDAMTGGRSMDRIAVIEPVFWGDTRAQGDPAGPRRVIVPGGVNFAARDFNGLVEALTPARQKEMQARNLELQVIGGGKDRAALEAMVAERGLGDVLTLLPLSDSGRVPYGPYVQALDSAWAIYPLLPLGWPPYRDHKITSAIPTAVGFGLPVVLDRWTERTYRVPALVSDGSIGAALDALIGLDAEARRRLMSEVSAYGRAARERNRQEMQRLLSRAACRPIRRTA